MRARALGDAATMSAGMRLRKGSDSQVGHDGGNSVTEAPPQQRTAFVDRRRATGSPMPNPGRRASDRAEYLSELARRSEVRELSGSPEWLRRYARGLIVVDLLGSLLAATLALAVRFGDQYSDGYLRVTLLFPLGFVVFVGANRGYEPRFL